MSTAETIQSIFTFGREFPFPSIYGENKTPVTVDVLEVGWIVAFFTGYFCFLVLLPATVGNEKALYFVRITLTAFIGITVMLCNFGQEWEVGKLESKMFYKAGFHEEIKATVGLKLGLRSVNITLYAKPDDLKHVLPGEKVDYNERFQWTWEQGRVGFGPFAGRIQREYREAQMKGVPYPILWIAEYFTFDGEGLRFGRHYRHAGWYAHICIWCAFICWILAIIFFKFFIRYGAIMLIVLGCFKMIAAIIWCSFRNFIELAIVFNNEENGILKTYYGVHWYLALLVGLFCIISGIGIWIADLFFHNELCKFFGVDPYGIIDEIYGDNQLENNAATNDIEMEDKGQFKGKRQKTVVYRARGTKKSWRNDETVEPVWDNAEYFDVTNNPTVDPNYLDIGYQHMGQPYYQRQSMSQEMHIPTAGSLMPEGSQGYYNPNDGAYADGDSYYQDTDVQMHQYNMHNAHQLGQIMHQQQQQDQQQHQPVSYFPDNEISYDDVNPLPLPPKRS